MLLLYFLGSDLIQKVTKERRILSIKELKEFQKNRTVPNNDQISLKLIQQYFEEYILPYKYTYSCDNSLTITFNIEKEQFCHLLYGSPGKISKAKSYKGMEGYCKIANETITFNNLDHSLKHKAKIRSKNFIFLETLLDKPKIIQYNGNIVKKGNDIKIGESLIDASFLMNKDINDQQMHFFIKNISSKKIVPITFFPQKDTCYIDRQIILKVHNNLKEKV